MLVADGIADPALAPGLADEAAAAVWDGYAAGLAEGGWRRVADGVRWAYLRGTSLRLSWLEPTNDAWRATLALLERWRDEARELASAS